MATEIETLLMLAKDGKLSADQQTAMVLKVQAAEETVLNIGVQLGTICQMFGTQEPHKHCAKTLGEPIKSCLNLLKVLQFSEADSAAGRMPDLVD